jgi:RES domain-containing protein
MPLSTPPPAPDLTRLPRHTLAEARLHRVYRRGRASPWWFASVPAVPAAGGRFDLPAPLGACYLASSVAAGVLEALQGFGRGLLPDVELRNRVCAEVVAPESAPAAAQLTSARARGLGITAALWAGLDRALTQRWALQLHRAGWRALWTGIQHDPTGMLRAVTLLDLAGEHPPYGASDAWVHTEHPLHGDPAVASALHRYGITVTDSNPRLPVVPLSESGLLP